MSNAPTIQLCPGTGLAPNWNGRRGPCPVCDREVGLVGKHKRLISAHLPPELIESGPYSQVPANPSFGAFLENCPTDKHVLLIIRSGEPPVIAVL